MVPAGWSRPQPKGKDGSSAGKVEQQGQQQGHLQQPQQPQQTQQTQQTQLQAKSAAPPSARPQHAILLVLHKCVDEKRAGRYRWGIQPACQVLGLPFHTLAPLNSYQLCR
eukprot:363375-Chlamydomonas_euryale.AAC.5